jgi:sodium transport system ATP-binding protein
MTSGGFMVEVKSLSKRYGPKVLAVDQVSFTTRDGEIYGLLGPNGAGKTTTLRMLATLLEPTSGTASVAGFDIRTQSENVRRCIGVVNGGMGLYDRLTGREVLEYFASFYNLSAAETNKRITELSGLLDMDALLDRKTAEFSTGMKQKIVIARAVIHQPSVLILDEATNGLDVVARRAVLDFARAYRGQGRTVIYSTHIMSEAEELCDRAAIIDQGRLLAEDTIPKLMTQTGTDSLEDAFFKLTRGPINRAQKVRA